MSTWSEYTGIIVAKGLGTAGAFFCLVALLKGQVPGASVRGMVTDDQARPIVAAEITAVESETGLAQTTETDSHGEYFFASLPRGLYSLKVKASGFQGLQSNGIELAVGARHEENLTLAPLPTAADQKSASDLFRTISPGPSLPVETLTSSVSVVVEENKILQLPLASRNIYSLFLLQPGVTSQEAISTRGLSFSVHGQRVSGSNYLLDGIDNNNIVLTGPVVTTSAEAIQEFRMVNSSFSSEYGRATAFVAQVGTRSGGNQFHGSLFEFLANDKLNANTFENNANGSSRSAFHRNQFGCFVGGPIARNRTFFSSGIELSRLRYETTRDFFLPSSSFTPENALSRDLLVSNPPLPSIPTGDPNVGFTRYQAPNMIDTLLATGRLDHYFGNAKDRILLRYALASTTQQVSDEFSGYPTLRPTDRFGVQNSFLGWTHAFDAGKVNDLRVGWSRERIELPRPDPEIPNLESFFDRVLLPASSRQMGAQENNNVVQFSEALSLRRGRSTLNAGFDYRRNISNGLTLGLQSEALEGALLLPDGIYLFPDLLAFGQGKPLAFAVGVDRFSSGPLSLPNLSRKYRSNEYAVFLQDDLKISRRLSLNLGFRYEFFGVLHSTDRSKDVNFYFGTGSTIQEELANGVLRSTDQNPGDLKGLLYRPDHSNYVPSVGVAWDPIGSGKTVLRAGYAVALDRLLDTIRDLRSNNLQVITCYPPQCPFVIPFQSLLSSLSGDLRSDQPGVVVQLDENVVTPYAQNWYFGVQQAVTPSLILELGHAGSVGRKLISRDLINRFVEGIPSPNIRIGEDTYLSNAANSNYLALELDLRRGFSRGLQYQVSYTYSHAIDNQSDIFEGIRTRPAPALPVLSTFTLPLDSRVDRGNANFDQRHNLVFNAVWDIPKLPFSARIIKWLSAGWTASLIGAYRSGFPVTVIGSTEDFSSELRNNRVDFIGKPGEQVRPSPLAPVPGGVQWLDAGLFQPADGHVGSLGRGALQSPGFWNYDVALIRTTGRSDSRIRVQFRAEFYNLLNHPNLSVPVSLFSEADFGRAYYGLNPTFSRFGDLPLASSARTIQFGLRIQF